MAIDGRGAPPHPISPAEARAVRRMVAASRVAAQDVDDVMQEVLRALAFRRDPIAVPEGVTPRQARRMFLHGVVARQVANYARRLTRLNLGDTLWQDIHSPEPPPSTEELVLALAWIGSVRRAIERLGETEPELREVIERLLGGEPIAGFAARSSIPEGTAWSRLRRARIALRALVRARPAG